MSELQWLEPEEIGRAVTILREAAGYTREDLTDLDLSPSGAALALPEIELIEDYGGLREIDEIEFYADALEVSPGEFLDAVIAVAEAERIDVQGELEDERQADQLWELLQANPTGVTYDEMSAAGIATGNVPFNILRDRGLPVAELRRPSPPRTFNQESFGVTIQTWKT